MSGVLCWPHVRDIISRGIWDIAVDLTGYGIRDMGYSLGLAAAGARDTGYETRDIWDIALSRRRRRTVRDMGYGYGI